MKVKILFSNTVCSWNNCDKNSSNIGVSLSEQKFVPRFNFEKDGKSEKNCFGELEIDNSYQWIINNH